MNKYGQYDWIYIWFGITSFDIELIWCFFFGHWISLAWQAGNRYGTRPGHLDLVENGTRPDHVDLVENGARSGHVDLVENGARPGHVDFIESDVRPDNRDLMEIDTVYLPEIK